jgi:Arc/MetJ-type ribon-helix-helix transcriptional regulator
MTTERETMKQETVTVAVRIPLEDYKILDAQMQAGNYKNMSHAVRAAVALLVGSLAGEYTVNKTEGNNESK